jgi:hypothetical protein
MKTFHDKVAAWIKTAQQYTKFWVAVVGGALVIITGELALDDEVVRYIRIGIAILTAFSVYQFPNVPSDGADE